MSDHSIGPISALASRLITCFYALCEYFAPINRYTRQFERVKSSIERSKEEGESAPSEVDITACNYLLGKVGKQVMLTFCQGDVLGATPWYKLEQRIEEALGSHAAV